MFCCKLPVADAVAMPAAPAQEPVVEPGRRLKIMVVDDHPANRLLVSQQLAYLGHDATAVESGEEALRRLIEARFDVVMTDFNMPGMNGFELARQCRELERLHGWRRTVILGLTADARQEQINEGQAAGMTVCSSPSDWRRSIIACVGTCSVKSRVTWSSAWRRSGGIWGR
jgi:two-component system sensor histidine kinase EvgS